jgi:hypothetical protein
LQQSRSRKEDSQWRHGEKSGRQLSDTGISAVEITFVDVCNVRAGVRFRKKHGASDLLL